MIKSASIGATCKVIYIALIVNITSLHSSPYRKIKVLNSSRLFGIGMIDRIINESIPKDHLSVFPFTAIAISSAV